MLKRTIWSVTLIFLVGCTAGPEIQKYSQTQIDRPYTLPKGIAQWETQIPYWFERNDSGSSSLPPILPIPLFWRSSLADSLTLHWSPIPAMLSWQALHDDQNMLGLSGGLSALGYATGSGLILGPSAKIDYWYRLSQRLSLRSSIYGDFIYYSESRFSQLRGAISLGPFVQISDGFALQPRIGIEARDGLRTISNLSSVYSGRPVFYPLELSGYLNLGRQWDLGATYRLLTLSAAQSYSLHTGQFFLTHSW